MKNNIRMSRNAVRQSQTELAEAVGVSRQTIHAIETGKYTPSTLLALKFARHFGCKVEDLFQLEETDA